MAPMPLSPGAKLKPKLTMTPSQAHSQHLSATTSSTAERKTEEATTCDSTDTTHMASRGVVLNINSHNYNNNNNNNKNNNNNISEKTNMSMTKPAAKQNYQKQQQSSNDFITNFFNNLKSTMQQQQQQQQQQKVASDNKDALYRQATAVATTATKTATTPTARCDSSSNKNNNASCNANKCEASNVVAAAVVIKTEVDAAATHDNNRQQQQKQQQKQQQEKQQEQTQLPQLLTSPTSISSSTSPAATSSSTTSSSTASSSTATSATTITTSSSPHDEKENETPDANESDNLMFAKPLPVLLSAVNPHIICNLCHGYLIDATTIVECLHSFCHSCIMRHLRTEQYCPRCEMMINTAKPNIKPDTTLQAIVYKLVPGLYEKELMRKRAFYKNKPEEAALATPEQRGDDTEHLIFSPSEYMSLSLEYADIEEHFGISTDSEFAELLKPKFLQCPSICTVAHLKKFVYGKFDIDTNLYSVDIMYKVKTIVLLDHYTLMDVAYIYTWKRDAPMRFYFRVKESPKPIVKIRKTPPVVETKQEVLSDHEEPRVSKDTMTIVHEATPTLIVPDVLPLTEIKEEEEMVEPEPTPLPHPTEKKTFEIVPQSNLGSSSGSSEISKTDKLKITIVTKGSREKRESNGDLKSPVLAKPSKEKKEHAVAELKDERKVENIKLKIDLSKQNSVTIINMSDPERKEIVKPVKPEREWKVKTKKDKGDSPKSSPSSDRERKRKTPSPLTVPPLTIKAERISPLAKTAPKVQSPNVDSSSSATNSEEEQKSQFLKSFALAPIKDVKLESPEKRTTPPKNSPKNSPPTLPTPNAMTLMRPPSCVLPKQGVSSKRKSKEPLKAIPKKPKFAYPLPTDDFKIRLPPSPHVPFKSSKLMPPPAAQEKEICADKLMPPPAPLTAMRPPSAFPKRPNKPQNKFAPPGSLTPHPSQGYQQAMPGNRTPIAKRYQPILPKASRPNPFANIPTDVNKILKDAGTEIKSISSNDDNTNPKVVYGPKTTHKSSMGPPQSPIQSSSSSNNSRGNPPLSSNKTNGSNNYLNLALFNSSKSKGNEVPPGCRTPMYSPNSPIYSPSSPQYTPNYNIPTIPTYKYTPKPSNANSSYFQSVLGTNSQMSSLFPAPPTKKPCTENASLARSNSPLKTTESTQKRVYPFAKSPSPVEDPPEKQLKVKSLLTSCNINIPSSLSITLTREDGESQLNNTSYPKHKSPVNNYIEILKLPDQTVESNEAIKRPSPPKQTPAPIPKKENNSVQPSQNRMHSSHNGISTKPTSNSHQKNMNFNFTKPAVTIHNVNHTNASSGTTVTANTKTTKTTSAKTNASILSTTTNVKPPMPPPAVNALKTSKLGEITGCGEKTPSPEKRSISNQVDTSNSPASNQGENKSPKSPNSDSAAAQAAKKFRHILPRQNPTPISEVIPPKATTGNIIGTYSSPSGVAVKVHANKKVPLSKKSPNCAPTPQNASTNNNKTAQPNSSPNSALPLVKTTTASPKSSPNQPKNPHTSKGKKPVPTNSQPAFNPSIAAPTSVLNKLLPPPHAALSSLPTISPHPMQPHSGLPNLPAHLGVAAANAANQAELGQFLKDNLLRAQVQAAAANQSNMFYSYANAAAQMGQFAPSMYNYQQAYIMEQLSRMQRAGNEAFVEYMQKLKNGGVDKMPTIGDADAESRNLASTKPSSPKTSPQTTTSNGSQKTLKSKVKSTQVL